MEVSYNGGTPKSSIFVWDFPFWGTLTSGNHQDYRHVFATACRCPKFPHRDCMALVSMGVPCDKRLAGVTQRNDRPSGKETYWGIPRCENQYFWHLLKSMFQRDWCFHGFHGLASHQYPHIRCRLGYSNPSTPFFSSPHELHQVPSSPKWSPKASLTYRIIQA